MTNTSLTLPPPAVRLKAKRTPAQRRRWLKIIVGTLFSFYLANIVAITFLQGWMIFPGRATQGKAIANVKPPPGTQIVPLKTADGESTMALFGPALTSSGLPHPDSAHCPTILFFHGNGECVNLCLREFALFRKLGANVLIPEYVGYGMSSGTPSESGCYSAADAAYAHLLTRSDIDPKKVVVVGWSLGGAVAIDLAARKPVAGLAAFSTFTSMAEIALRQLPFLPVAHLLRHKFESAAKIGHIHCPMLLGHGRRDRLIPLSMSERLESAAKTSVTRFVVADAAHNDFFPVGEKQIRSGLLALLQGL